MKKIAIVLVLLIVAGAVLVSGCVELPGTGGDGGEDEEGQDQGQDSGNGGSDGEQDEQGDNENN